MANKKISDGALVASVVGTTEFEISNGTATQLKCNSSHIGNYAVTTQTYSSLATTNKEVDSAINEVNSDLGAHEIISNPHTGSSPSFASITATTEVITNKIKERTVDGGIEINVGGNSGAFYDYPTPPDTWFVFSGSGSPDDGTNIYLPYDSSDGTWFGYGMGATDVIHFGAAGDETTMTGDGQFKSNKLTLGSTQQVDTISSDTTFATALNTELATKAAVKSYVDNSVSSALQQETLAVNSNGQTAFTLSSAPGSPEHSLFFLNGQVRLYTTDFTISGTSLTWNDPGSLTLLTTDVVQIWYR